MQKKLVTIMYYSKVIESLHDKKTQNSKIVEPAQENWEIWIPNMKQPLGHPKSCLISKELPVVSVWVTAG